MPPLRATTAAPATSTTKAHDPNEQAAKDAETVYRRFLTIARRIGTSGGTDITGLDEVSTGDALAQYQLIQRTYIDKGWTDHGSQNIASIKVVSASPASAKILSCLHYDRAFATGRDGKRVKGSDQVEYVRASAQLVHIGDAWKVRKLVATKDSTCD